MSVRLDAMPHFPRALQWLLFLSILFIAGCSPGAEQNEKKFKIKPTDQDTPQAALKKAMMAILDDDYDSFDITVFQGSAATRPFFDGLKKADALRTALTEKYGDGAWEEFNSILNIGPTLDLTNMFLDRDIVLADLKKDIAFDVNEDFAYCIVPWNGRKQKFRKASNGAWYGDFGGETKYMAVHWTGTNLAIDAVMKSITKEGITLRELKKILDQTDNDYQKKALKELQ
jgi:hypothetical protein